MKLFNIIVLGGVLLLIGCGKRSNDANVNKINVNNVSKEFVKDSVDLLTLKVNNQNIPLGLNPTMDLLKINDFWQGDSSPLDSAISYAGFGQLSFVGLGGNGNTVWMSRNKKYGLLQRYDDQSVLLKDQFGNLLSTRRMNDYDFNPEIPNRILVREDGKGIIIYMQNGPKSELHIFGIQNKLLVKESVIKLSDDYKHWQIVLGTEGDKIYALNNNRDKKANSWENTVKLISINQRKILQTKSIALPKNGQINITTEGDYISILSKKIIYIYDENLNFLTKFLTGGRSWLKPIIFNGNGHTKIAHFDFNNIYIYDIEKEALDKIAITDGFTISDLVFINENEILFGTNMLNTKYTWAGIDSSRIVQSYLISQSLIPPYQAVIEKEDTEAVWFYKEAGKLYGLSHFASKKNYVFQIQ